MSDWNTTEPPLDLEIEFERDGLTVQKGKLQTAGAFGMGANARNAAARMKNQYRREGLTEMFEVTRWRTID